MNSILPKLYAQGHGRSTIPSSRHHHHSPSPKSSFTVLPPSEAVITITTRHHQSHHPQSFHHPPFRKLIHPKDKPSESSCFLLQGVCVEGSVPLSFVQCLAALPVGDGAVMRLLGREASQVCLTQFLLLNHR